MKFRHLVPNELGFKFATLLISLSRYFLLVQSQSSPLHNTNVNSTSQGLTFPNNATVVAVPTPPSGFQVDWHYDPTEPLNILAIYLSTIDSMYNLAQKGWSSRIEGGLSVWATGFSVEVDIESSQGLQGPLPLLVSHVVIALYDTVVELSKNKLLRKVTATLSLQQRQLGVLKIQKLAGMPSLITTNNGTTNLTIGDLSTTMAAGPSGKAIDADDSRFSIVYAYDGTRIGSQDIFIAILDGLATAAQYDDFAPFTTLKVISASKNCEIYVWLDGPYDDMSYSFVTKGLRMLTWDVILRLKRFGGMTFEMQWEGEGISKGYIKEIQAVDIARRGVESL